MLNESEYDLQDYADREGWFPGGTPDFKSQPDDRIGAKVTPPPPKKKKKIPGQNKFHAEFPSHRNQFQRNYEAGIRGNYQESWGCFEYPQKSQLNQATQKKYLQNFLTQKNPEIENLKPKKILRSPLSLEIRGGGGGGLVFDRGG